MKEDLRPIWGDLCDEAVLFQAWKKTAAYIRSHNWYADTLELDWQALRVPEFIGEIRQRLNANHTWEPLPLRMVPAPKAQKWSGMGDDWRPDGEVKIRPLAHVDLADQVIATAILLCLADRVETAQGNPVGSIRDSGDRRAVLSYGHRLFCDVLEGRLRHRWGSKKLYRQFSTDYQRFLARPDAVAELLPSVADHEVAIVHTDLSRFYDRVRPELLREKLNALKRQPEEDSFFDFAATALNWRWADEKRAATYEEKEGIEGFQAIALPQGLVSAGFFSNIVLLSFDERLRQAFGQAFGNSGALVLRDACRYVDDLRLVVQVPKGLSEEAICGQVVTRLNQILAEETPETSRLFSQLSKSKAVVVGRPARFLVPQSRTAERIQHEISGGFDVAQGAQLISAIEGFFHTQRSYPAEAATTALDLAFHGASDMRDDTAARFAAARFRRTFRALRPLLEADEVNLPDDDESADVRLRDIILSQEQLDERAEVFAASLIEGWETDPSHVRLLRVGLDICPRPDFLERVLARLRPAWQPGRMRGERREVLIYCLAELFRAGATETGIVTDRDVLPASADVETYHARLLEEAITLCEAAQSSSYARFPWYLRQQAMLYILVQGAAGRLGDSFLRGPKRSPLLGRYIDFLRFLRGQAAARRSDAARFYVLAIRCFGRSEFLPRAIAECDADILRHLAAFAPSFAQELWRQLPLDHRETLSRASAGLRLEVTYGHDLNDLLSIADAAATNPNPWQDEHNLLMLAREVLRARRENPDGVLTPWRVFCHFQVARNGSILPRFVEGSIQIRSARGGESFFEPPSWCETADERVAAELGQILRFCLTRSLDFLRPVPRQLISRLIPKYRPAPAHWEQTRYGVYQGRSAFGPAWLPLSSWVENLLLELLRAPGTGQPIGDTSAEQIEANLTSRIGKLTRQRGDATGLLFLEQHAPFPHKPLRHDWCRPLRIGIVQSVIPSDADFVASFHAGDRELNAPEMRRRHRRHLRAILAGVQQMLRVRETHRVQPRHDGGLLDWLILPELAVHPDDVESILMPFVRAHRCILTAGLVYHPRDQGAAAPLINSAVWLIPEWTPQHGLNVRTIEQGKARLAPEEEDLVGPHVVGFRPTQWIVHYEWHHSGLPRPLFLSTSVCYDATDVTLAADLRDKNDFYAICALNSDIQTFDNLAMSLNYHLFQGVLIVNNGTYGGSNFFAPLERPYRRQILHFHGQPQAVIGFAEVDPGKMIARPHTQDEEAPPTGRWKDPPAGWIGPIA